VLLDLDRILLLLALADFCLPYKALDTRKRERLEVNTTDEEDYR
jgi:hypothetical protein